VKPHRSIHHGEVSLALHELAGARVGPRLLLLHELRGSSDGWGPELEPWPGEVFALDFAGHGASDWRAGGAYTPELFAADADAALAELGPCMLAGAGIGAYAALLVAGARPDLVPAALLLPGDGLDGVAIPDLDPAPGLIESIADLETERRASRSGLAPDPLVASCTRDPRPADYAAPFALAARRLLLFEDDDPRPAWWDAVRANATVFRGSRRDALSRLARAAEPVGAPRPGTAR
jgi:pimeloyl-ACP methyl ester carboxylesterase